MYKITYTLVEAARILGCHADALRKAVLDGSLHAAKLGRSYRVSHAELQKFWELLGGGELFDKSETLSYAEEGAGDFAQTNIQAAGKKTITVRKKPAPDQFVLPVE
jgi:excisionase family DNA binding protein